MTNKAIEWGVYDGENLAVLIKAHPMQPRKRFIQEDEMIPLLERLEEEPLALQLYFLFELCTGCRPGEARLLKWADLKIFKKGEVLCGRWTKRETKNGAEHVIPLPPVICERLLELLPTNKEEVSEWVFRGAAKHPRRKQPGPMSVNMVHRHWTTIREDAGIPDVRPHDLRRTCVTWLNHHGTSLSVISKGVLQHTNLQHTSRYVQAMPDDVEKALNAHAERLLGRR